MASHVYIFSYCRVAHDTIHSYQVTLMRMAEDEIKEEGAGEEAVAENSEEEAAPEGTEEAA